MKFKLLETVDNIPGIREFYPKTAAQLINEFGSVEGLIDNVRGPQQKEKVNINSQKSCSYIKKLVQLKSDVDLPLKINELDFKPLEVNKLLKFLDDLEFSG